MKTKKKSRAHRKVPGSGGRKHNHVAGTVARRAETRSKPPIKTPWVDEEPTEQAIGLLDLSRLNVRCRWPVGLGIGIEQQFCGCRVEDEDQPYCPTHRKRAYRPLSTSGGGRGRRSPSARPLNSAAI